MAYYAPFYRPNLYDQQPHAQYGQQFQPMPQSGNGPIWVQGETGAKSYLVAPGNTVMLMDSENEVFYLKSADNSGMPLPLRTFDYKERTQQTVPPPSTEYITRDEFERRIASIIPQDTSKNTAEEEKNG